MTPSDPTPRPDAASNRARDWYPYCDDKGMDVVTPEIVAAIAPHGVAALTQPEMQMRFAESKGLLHSAATGSLRDQHFKPVTKDPILWELRWRWEDNTQLRGYFHEPLLETDSTILAKVHEKRIVSGSETDTRRLQNEAIDEASIRIRRGERHRWGLGEAKKLN